MIWGVSAPTNGPSFAGEMRAAGAGMVRIVATGRHDLGAVLREYRGAGLRTLLVLARESLESVSAQDWVEFYARNYGELVDAVQVGNEPDAHGGASSWQVTPSYIDTLIVRAQAFRERNPACKVIGPGLISGRVDAPLWLSQLRTTRLLDAVAWHCYWERPEGLGDVVRSFQAAAQRAIPVYVTEFNLADDAGPRTEFVRALARTPGIEAALVYCWQRWSGWPWALMDGAGRPLPLLETFKGLARELDMSTTAELEAKIKLLEQQQSLTVDLMARILSGKWDQGAESAEALLRAIAPKYGSFEAVAFPPKA